VSLFKVGEEPTKTIDAGRETGSGGGSSFYLLRDKLLACGWVMSYALVLAVFQVVKQLESISKREAGGKISSPAS